MRFIKPAILLAALLTGCQQQKALEETRAPQPTNNPPAAAPAAAQIAGTPADTVMTPEYVATVGRVAYIWGWPLVNNLNRSIGMASGPSASTTPRVTLSRILTTHTR